MQQCSSGGIRPEACGKAAKTAELAINYELEVQNKNPLVPFALELTERTAATIIFVL